MAPQTGKQIITMHLLPNISRSKDNTAMMFGHLIRFKVRNSFLQKSCRKWGREPNSRLKSLCVQHLSFNIFW